MVESVGVEVASGAGVETTAGAVRVKWDHGGASNVYRYGAKGCYDVARA